MNVEATWVRIRASISVTGREACIAAVKKNREGLATTQMLATAEEKVGVPSLDWRFCGDLM